MSIFNSEKTCGCSFCGKPHTSVIKLIAGPGIYICDECVIICSEILAKEIPEWPKHIRCPKDPIKVNHDMLKAMRDAGEITELVFNARLAEAVCREFSHPPKPSAPRKRKKDP